METAVGYAEEFGWRVVPLNPSPTVAEKHSDDPVIRLLGRSPLVEVPHEASDQPDELRELTGFPIASLAVLTGEDSNLAAVELGPAAKRGLQEDELKQFRRSLPGTRLVCGPDRDYHLFSLRSLEEESLDLPRLARSDGVILHGEHSLVRVPGPRAKGGVRAFRWDVQAGTGIAPFPKELLSFFGVETGVQGVISWSKQPSPSPDKDEPALGPDGRRAGGSFSTGTSSPSRDHPGEKSGGSRLSFRSGEELSCASQEEEAITALPPWLSEGALSVLCGPAKTGGKSTFVANLAVHLAAGEPFLENDLDSGNVVMLSDLPASQFRNLLSRFGVGPKARKRLHVIHPEDAGRQSWQTLLDQTFGFAERRDASLVVLDSLDQFVQVKGGVDPTTEVDVVHMLSTDSPPSAAVLAVKALGSECACRMSTSIDRLGLLGKAADVVARMDAGPTDASPTLRRLQFAGRLEGLPTHLLCEMVRGRYQRVRRPSQGTDVPLGDGHASHDLSNQDVPLPEIIGTADGADPEENMLDGAGPRPSIVHQELTGSSSES